MCSELHLQAFFECSNSCSRAIQPTAIQDVITSTPSLLSITAALSEVPARVADSRLEPRLIQVLQLQFKGYGFSTNLVSLMS